MPKFIDYHARMPQLPPEAMQQMVGAIKSGKADQFGVKPLNVYVGKGGQGYCLTEAPSADAVCKTHEAQGIHIGKGEVVEIQSLV